MKYKDHLTPWRPAETVLYDWEKIELFARYSPIKFAKAWLDIEEDIKDELKCAAIRARVKK